MPPEPTSSPSISKSRLWELGKEVLAIAVIPLVGWVINLSIQNALRDEYIHQLQGEVAGLQSVKTDLQTANIQLVKLEAKIDIANGRLDDIKQLLR